jgi:hypothetical protein
LSSTRVVGLELEHERVEVPLFGEDATDLLVDDVGQAFFDELDRRVVDVLTVDDLEAALVDDLALLVHHLVVLEDVLADLGVAPSTVFWARSMALVTILASMARRRAGCGP